MVDNILGFAGFTLVCTTPSIRVVNFILKSYLPCRNHSGWRKKNYFNLHEN